MVINFCGVDAVTVAATPEKLTRLSAGVQLKFVPSIITVSPALPFSTSREVIVGTISGSGSGSGSGSPPPPEVKVTTNLGAPSGSPSYDSISLFIFSVCASSPCTTIIILFPEAHPSTAIISVITALISGVCSFTPLSPSATDTPGAQLTNPVLG